MNYRKIALGSLAAATIALAACHGGGQTLPSVPNGATKAAVMTKATLKLVIPAKTASARRRPAFVSPSTKGIVVAVFTSPYHNGAVPVSNGAFDVSASSPNCTPAVSGGGSTCTFSISVPAGTDDFVVTNYDTAPVNNAIPSGATRLGYGRDSSVTITAGQGNQVNVALGGVVAKVAIPLPRPSSTPTATDDWACGAASTNTCTIQHATHTLTEAVSVNAYDPGGNVIVSDGWYDADGNPVTVTVSADAGSNSGSVPVLGFGAAPPMVLSTPLPGGATPTPLPSGVISPPPTPTPAASVTLTGPTANQFFITYNPWNMVTSTVSDAFANGFGSQTNGNTTTLTALPSNVAAGAVSGTAKIQLLPALLAPIPVPSAPSGSGANATYLSVATDKTFWVTQSVGGIVHFNPATSTWSSAYPASPASGFMYQNLPSKDGSAIWVADRTNHALQKFSLATSAFASPVVLPTPLGAYPQALAQTTSNGIWFTEPSTTAGGSLLKKLDPATGVVTAGPAFTATCGGQPFTVTNGKPLTIAADGDTIWVADSATQTPNCTQPFLYKLDLVNNPNALVAYQWPGAQSSAGITAIAVDPNTHRVWAALNGSLARLAYFDPSAGKWSQEYPAGAYTGTGWPHLSGTPNQIAFASDGSVWVTEQSSGKIGHLTLNADGTYTFYELSILPGSNSFGIVPDPDPTTESIWIIDNSKNNLYHLYL
jgi:streptogramin lyase